MKSMSNASETERLVRGPWALIPGLVLMMFSAAGCGGGGSDPGPVVASATLSWTPPSTSTDGSALTDLAGYNVYFSQTSPVTAENSFAVSVSDPSQTSYTVSDLTPGTYYFTVTAVDSTGNESELSEEVSKVI